MRTTLKALCAVLALAILVSCAESQIDEAVRAQANAALAEAAAARAAESAGLVAEAARHQAAAEGYRQRVAELEARRAEARASDDQFWNFGTGTASGLANIFLPGAGAAVGAFMLALSQRLRGRTFHDGLATGATTATTAITNADVGNVLQKPEVLTAVNNNLVGAPSKVVAAVNAAI